MNTDTPIPFAHRVISAVHYQRRSHIAIITPVAADPASPLLNKHHSNNAAGALTQPAKSMQWHSFPVTASRTCTFLSSPPTTMRVPSGEKATVLTCDTNKRKTRRTAIRRSPTWNEPRHFTPSQCTIMNPILPYHDPQRILRHQFELHNTTRHTCVFILTSSAIITIHLPTLPLKTNHIPTHLFSTRTTHPL